MKFSHHIIIGQTLTDLQGKLDSILAAHPQQQVVFKRYFLPDEILRQQFPAEKGAVSYIIQPVLCEGSVALWLVLCEGAQVHDQGRETILEGEGIRLIIIASLTCPEGTSEQQTRSIFGAYAALLEARGLTLEGNCVRTWLFCDDIDHQYAGLVKARREFFAACGLTPQTHFIASTGIAGRPAGAGTPEGAYSLVSANEPEGCPPADSLSAGSAEEQAAIRRVVNLVRENIAQLAPYSTARDEYSGPVGIFLDANESPYPTGWNRYPDPHQKVLKEKISAIKGVPVQSIFLGNGSDEAIDLVFRVFCTPGRDNVVAIAPSYGMYSVAAATNDISLHTVLLGKDFSLPVEALAAATDSRSKVLFLCSPNNPSGNAFPQEQLIEVIRRFPGMVVVDEAYADFSTKGSLLPRLAELPNLIVLQTFSKAYGLAGLRLGLAYAHPYVIRLMSQVKYPYNINQSTQLLAMKALETPIEPYVREILAQRERLVEELPKLPCVRKVWPSDANFLLVEFSDADATYAHLLADGIIVRNRSRVPLCAGCLRLTVGLPEENDRLLASLQRLCHLQKTE